MICRHCQRKDANKCRGLCVGCYYAVGVRDLYPTPMSKLNRAADKADTETLTPRQPGEPPCRCLWCSEWRCGGPLQKCDDCQREYDERAATMPAADEPLSEEEIKRICPKCGKGVKRFRQGVCHACFYLANKVRMNERAKGYYHRNREKVLARYHQRKTGS